MGLTLGELETPGVLVSNARNGDSNFEDFFAGDGDDGGTVLVGTTLEEATAILGTWAAGYREVNIKRDLKDINGGVQK